MFYETPGQADGLSPALLQRWNDTITSNYAALSEFHSRFFSVDPAVVSGAPSNPAHWFGDPAEPEFCLDRNEAQILSDWGIKGRQVLQNEYCEYLVIQGQDSSGKVRPKRVVMTTELREYWVCLAKFDPDKTASIAQSVLGFAPRMEDLYGVSDPKALSAEQREVAFSRLVAGHGNDPAMMSAGVPAQPTGPLNTQHLLFMSHPINGLDDLLYIVMFGAKPYASRDGEGRRVQATKEQLFRKFGVEHLACRHADPAAAMAALSAAFAGSIVAFANPLGMYFVSFSDELFSYKGRPIPNKWVRWSRGARAGLYQRLEFGPLDDDEAFLDDIIVSTGASDVPVTGGFQIAEKIEVGPLLVVGPSRPLTDNDYIAVDADASTIECARAKVCETVRALKREHDAGPLVAIAPRRIGRSPSGSPSL